MIHDLIMIVIGMVLGSVGSLWFMLSHGSDVANKMTKIADDMEKRAEERKKP